MFNVNIVMIVKNRTMNEKILVLFTYISFITNNIKLY